MEHLMFFSDLYTACSIHSYTPHTLKTYRNIPNWKQQQKNSKTSHTLTHIFTLTAMDVVGYVYNSSIPSSLLSELKAKEKSCLWKQDGQLLRNDTQRCHLAPAFRCTHEDIHIHEPMHMCMYILKMVSIEISPENENCNLNFSLSQLEWPLSPSQQKQKRKMVAQK